ncbi:MAG: hypothetical protein AAGF11_48620 [Myxococcota bacterium]
MKNPAQRVVDGLRRHGAPWAQTRECAEALAQVLGEGTADEVMAAVGAVRRYRVVQAARRAVARHAPKAPRGALVARRLTGRELLAALVSWAEREQEAHLEGDRLTFPTEALQRLVVQLGDCPGRVLRVLRAGGLLEQQPRRTSGPPVVVLRIPRGALAS